MRPAALLSLLLLASPVAAQVNAVDMRSGYLTFTNLQAGLTSTSLFFVPSGSRFVLTDVTVSRTASSGAFDASSGGPAIRLTINNGGGTSVPRWISTDRLVTTDDPLQIHWTTGIVFEPSAVVEAAISVNTPTPTVTVCWSGYLTPATTTSVNPGPPTSGDLAFEARPNPSHEATQLSFTLKEKQRVTIGVFAVDGRRVRTLSRGVLDAGEHRVTWDGRDDAGRLVANGVYFAGLETADGQTTRRIARVR